jgi:carbon-monoxide dehydrogenase medium subunit/2-furoyl-CoA dehydrogenase FAD binding subunit
MLRPVSLDEAARLIAANREDARLIAGGQSLVPLLNFRLATPAVLIDLNCVAGLTGITRDGPVVHIGAMTRQQELLDTPLIATNAPLLAQAASHVGHIQTRSRGTVGGSLAQADPSTELPLAVVALDATITIESVRGRRTIAARSFFHDALETDLAPDEILTDIAVPVARASARFCFREFARRHGDFAIVAVAIHFDPPILDIAIAGLESVPRLCLELADSLRASAFAHGEIEPAVEREVALAIPSTDLQASAEFRRHLARVLLHDCLHEVFSP